LRLQAAGHLTDEPTPTITPTGQAFFTTLGLDLPTLAAAASTGANAKATSPEDWARDCWS